ncbi:endonuclease III domain-containing protein [Stigmatella aurantiaca]|uniref:Base excision DNA repair protein, HhH-GPD family n=2 Tax=Stigmatella aurantiaca (strain DW4/3-1) TaxID=378806 RepID=E3FZA6_STIAD|nr:endonuclease III [Stigmatella aurantiaca]ADO74923.1 Base excision DNA repair protein, HhH-GPD family [Stigmatella aurantiaca DW4/3-1]
MESGQRDKVPFEIEAVLGRIRQEVRGFADAAMFALAAQGHTTLFEQLVACILSIRTRDEVSLPTSLALLRRAHTPEAMSQLTPEEIEALIAQVTFPEPKARQIHALAKRTVEEFGGQLPADAEVLQSFRGVGPKCAHLALGVACGHEAISVDIHVHRVTNRWGYVRTRSPEQTLKALEARLPRAYWIEINRLLVPFGKHVCTGSRPQCSRCPVLAMCQQVGVLHPR